MKFFQVFRKLEQSDGNRRRNIKWSCDNENNTRYWLVNNFGRYFRFYFRNIRFFTKVINDHFFSCNPDHVDSYCPNTIAFAGKNPIFAIMNRVMHRNNVAKALHNVTEDYKRWCFISFIRCEFF